MYLEKRVNKKGWIRITEAVVAILIMASVLIVIYTNQTPRVSFSEYVYDLQARLLTEVADNNLWRNATINSNVSYLKENYFDLNIPSFFDYNITICDLENSASCVFFPDTEKEVYVEDRIISSTLETYDPKLLRLYIWEKG
jgi:hypothetical protein